MTSDGFKAMDSLLLVGCGRMGGALLRGWMASRLPNRSVTVIDPRPAEWLLDLAKEGLTLNQFPSRPPTVAVIATKPQVMKDTLPDLEKFGNGPSLFVSIAAGTPISEFSRILGVRTPIVRAMPNIPASVGAGMTALVPNNNVTESQLELSLQLMNTVGQSLVLESEDQMHAVTALSGSGPAYVFALAEALIEAGISQGLTATLAEKLAMGTVYGAGKLMNDTDSLPNELRKQVTSPAGTTAAGLDVLLQDNQGLVHLVSETIAAAVGRSRELGAS